MAAENDLGRDDIKKLVVRIAIPSMLAQFVSVLYSIVDRMYIGNIPGSGDMALAGAGVCGPVVTMVGSVAFLVGIGGAPLMSMKMGQGDKKAAERILANCFLMLAVCSILMVACIYPIRIPMLRYFGASDITLPYANAYFTIYLTGTVFALMSTGMNQFIICQGFAKTGMYSVIPTAFVSFDFSALGETFGQVFKTDFSGVGLLNFFAVMFSFLFVDLFDTLGTLIGVASKADMLDEDGRLPNIKGALMADSIGTCVGAVLGTSTTTTFVESASGVTEGGRTGLTAMTTGVLFLLATIFSPLFLTIPSFATAPALIIVGFYMMGSAIKIDFNDPSEGIPAFLTILAMPTAYSISEGIAIGIISWTIINVITGKAKEKKISPLMYVLTVLFILKYVCL